MLATLTISVQDLNKYKDVAFENQETSQFYYITSEIVGRIFEHSGLATTEKGGDQYS